MSKFVLKREYALELPMSYSEVDRDEMEYVDGGVAGWIIDAFKDFVKLAIGKTIDYNAALSRWQRANPSEYNSYVNAINAGRYHCQNMCSTHSKPINAYQYGFNSSYY